MDRIDGDSTTKNTKTTKKYHRLEPWGDYRKAKNKLFVPSISPWRSYWSSPSPDVADREKLIHLWFGAWDN
jgi:hypothetical protein